MLNRTRIARYAVELASITMKPKEDTGLAPFVVMHGMLGNMNNWRTPGRMLAEKTGREVHCVDLRNHGSSPHTPEMTLEHMAHDVTKFVDEQLQTQAIVLGHSLGGKAAMKAALLHPEHYHGLIVADIAPINYYDVKRKAASHSLSYIRYLRDMPPEVMADLDLADKYLEAHGVEHRGVRQFLLTNLRRNVREKKTEWRANLDVLEDAVSNGELVSFKAKDLTPNSLPTFIMTGGKSPYVKMERDGPAFDAHFPNNDHFSIPDAGHWLHAQEPAVFTDAIADWVKNLE
eukprot:TRINITY_DN5469_c0_g3_i1.p1 TRINITY_DN5469_c0_g3~~TRINITY_DN5469_c0_g3_i1.p1  ORF type:complete len:288 (+),score=54.22 TRINITY_DN5469_c0_g3_i1:46-909(+)